MLGRTLIAATALAAALAIPPALPDAGAAVRGAAVHGTVDLSNKDNGRTVGIRNGDRITVRLTAGRADGERWEWDGPQASSAAVLKRVDGRVSPGGDAVAHFRAQSTGTSALTAHRRCVVTRPGHRCPHVVVPSLFFGGNPRG
ncbi:hypothetical protein ACIHFE_20160 [Streptomyces sp. NPDC052396]|uniref:hypothetical protein n=1 Tax=Streptomyces sp. NPDC052396 TaxID=3365689 RepID=UPI0037CE9BEF